MNLRYRIKGTVTRPFILRSLHCKIGFKIDLSVTEQELEFVKDRCEIEEIVDLAQPNDNSTPVPKIQKQNQGGAKNELSKSTRTTKTSSKKSV